MSTYPYDNDYELVRALGNRIRLERLEDVQPGEDLILHNSRWWLVTEETYPETGLELELAGPSCEGGAKTSTMRDDRESLAVVTSVESGLQFVEGVLQDVPWPDLDLIYVKSALRRRINLTEDAEVFGIFSRRYDSDGDSYYFPVDQELQQGVKSHWLLDPRYDLIRDWEPVDVAGLLEEFRGGGRG